MDCNQFDFRVFAFNPAGESGTANIMESIPLCECGAAKEGGREEGEGREEGRGGGSTCTCSYFVAEEIECDFQSPDGVWLYVCKALTEILVSV